MFTFTAKGRAAAVKMALENSEDLSRAEKAAIVDYVIKPSQNAIDQVWRILVFTLASVLVLSLIAIFALEIDTDSNSNSSTIVTLFTATLTGLLGLFVKQPGGALSGSDEQQ